MIFRMGFVSNSSSSSFAIKMVNLNAGQKQLIWNHDDQIDEDRIFDDAWTIREEDREGEKYITGTTWLDNFDMETYLHDVVGIPDEFITWE